LEAELTQAGDHNSTPKYTIVSQTDLNGDGLPDYIVLNQTYLYCGSGGCSYQVYLNNGGGKFTQIQAPDIQQAVGLMVRDGDGRWKDIIAENGGQVTSYTTYTVNSFEGVDGSYTPRKVIFCGGIAFDYCSNPVVFCPLSGTDFRLADDANVYNSPFDEPGAKLTPSANNPDNGVPRRAPDGFHWVAGETEDGTWFLVNFKFVGGLYVRRADIRDAPPPPSPCK
jgi:hypothetical protein